jgi:glycosyltransferase involved in cell wall biosynthesis
MLIPGVRLVHTVHRADGDLISSHLFLRKQLLKRAGIITAVSIAAAEKFAEVNGYSQDKIKVVYNGIDISGFGINSVSGNDKDGFIIGTVANLSGDKDIETLLRAFANTVETRHALSLR